MYETKGQESYDKGAWAAFTYVLNHLNTYDTKMVDKSKLYADIMKMHPNDMKKVCNDLICTGTECDDCITRKP